MPRARRRARVVVLHAAIPPGAPADEQDSLVQAESVVGWLEALGHQVTRLALDLDLRPLERLAGEDVVVFNLVEALRADGRLAAAVAFALEALAIPFTGARGTALTLTTDKVLTKRLLAGHGIATSEWVEAPGQRPLPGRWIVKPRYGDASIGIDETAVVDAAAVPDALARSGSQLFAERYIEGREFNLSVLELAGRPRLLPPAEIDFSAFPIGRPRIVDYAAKWDPTAFAFHNTPRRFLVRDSEPKLFSRLQRLACRCWHLCDLTGYARIDLRLDANGTPVVLEINANPCLSPDAGFLAAAERAGLSPPEVVQAILDAAR